MEVIFNFWKNMKDYYGKLIFEKKGNGRLF